MTNPVTTGTGMVRVWDLPTRVFHWALVLLVVSSWASAEFSDKLADVTMRWHRWAGYSLLVLLVWRLLWGLVGSPASRFASFVSSPRAALAYGQELVRGHSRRYLGHNPLGAWMVLALLAVVAAQATIGLFTVEHDELANGPLARLVSESWWKPIRRTHHFLFENVLLPLIALHVVANALYGLLKREPLVKAMVTGDKPAGAYADAAALNAIRPVHAVAVRAILCLAASTALVFGVLLTFGGRL